MKKGKSTKKTYLGLEKNKAIILGMAIVMFVSMAAGIASSLINDDSEVVEAQVSKAQVVIDFGNYSRESEILNISDGETAYTLFSKIGTVTLDFVENNFVITKVEVGENSEEVFNNTVWVFYVNGMITFDPPDMYRPKQGDYLELKYEENPF